MPSFSYGNCSNKRKKKVTRKSMRDFNGKKTIKIEVARRIAAFLRENDLSQADACKQFDLDAGVISHICNANLGIFTLDRLIGVAEKMGIVATVNFE